MYGVSIFDYNGFSSFSVDKKKAFFWLHIEDKDKTAFTEIMSKLSRLEECHIHLSGKHVQFFDEILLDFIAENDSVNFFTTTSHGDVESSFEEADGVLASTDFANQLFVVILCSDISETFKQIDKLSRVACSHVA